METSTGTGADLAGMAATGAETAGTETGLPSEMMEPAGDTAGTLNIEFTTQTYGGRCAPRSYVATWIEQTDGTFLKTLQRLAGDRHQSDLGAWHAASGGWSGGGLFGGGQQSPDMVDAVSDATLNSHQTHMISWDFMVEGSRLPDGDYVVKVEMTEDRASPAGPVFELPFSKDRPRQAPP